MQKTFRHRKGNFAVFFGNAFPTNFTKKVILLYTLKKSWYDK